MKNAIGNLIRIALSLYLIALYSIVVLTILILPIHEHIFPSVYVVFNFFHHHDFGSFISMFFLFVCLFFDVMVNGIVSYISLLIFCCEYRNPIDFCVLIL